MIKATIKVPSEYARAQAAALYVRRASFLIGLSLTFSKDAFGFRLLNVVEIA